MDPGTPVLPRERRPNATDLSRLAPLMERSRGSAQVAIGLLDGPVATSHPQLADARIRTVGTAPATVTAEDGAAAEHGTFVAGILVADPGSAAPSLCPGCTLLTRPIFTGMQPAEQLPRATLDDLVPAILDVIRAGARVVNLSAEETGSSMMTTARLHQALDHATRAGVIVVAAAGNRSTMGGSAIISHPAVIPTVAVDGAGAPLAESSLCRSTGTRGLGAPGAGILSLAAHGGVRRGGGSSVAAAFVTGAAALLWSLFPDASATEIKNALVGGRPRRTVVPPLLDGEAAYQRLSRSRGAVTA